MIERPPGLPDYRRPPVSEVAIALAFQPVTAMRQAHLGMFWSVIREDFPNVDDRPPVDMRVEELDAVASPAFELRLVEAPSVSRAWFLSEDGTRLIQLQRDRLVLNWRGEGDAYPRFNSLAASFLDRLGQFSAWLDDEDLGNLDPRQLEVTYVNRLGAGSLASYLTPLNDVPLARHGFRPQALDAAFSTRYDLIDGDDTIARLYIEARPVADPADDPPRLVNTLTLTFRAPTRSSTAADLEFLMGAGRNAIVTAFTDLTTPDHHTLWGRTQ